MPSSLNGCPVAVTRVPWLLVRVPSTVNSIWLVDVLRVLGQNPAIRLLNAAD